MHYINKQTFMVDCCFPGKNKKYLETPITTAAMQTGGRHRWLFGLDRNSLHALEVALLYTTDKQC